jgi:hypothetical protein
MAEKSGFEALKTGSALLKKRDVCGKGGAAGGANFIFYSIGFSKRWSAFPLIVC